MVQIGLGTYRETRALRERNSRVGDERTQAWDARHTLRELRMMRLLRGHPNIIQLRGAVCCPGGSNDLFLVMELMDTDLHRIIVSKQALTVEHTSCMMAQLLLGVRAMHSVSMLHRDLKPGNVLVSRDCRLRITDFGLSRCIASTQHEDEATKGPPAAKNPLTEYVVTRWYRSPEVLLAPHLAYGARSAFFDTRHLFSVF